MIIFITVMEKEATELLGLGKQWPMCHKLHRICIQEYIIFYLLVAKSFSPGMMGKKANSYDET